MLKILLAVVSTVYSFTEYSNLKHIRSITSASVQEEAVRNLIQRLLKDRAEEFVVKIDSNLNSTNKDIFQLSFVDFKLHIIATSGVAAAWGLHYYLKYFCFCHIAWSGNQLNVPKPLPVIAQPITITSMDRFRYYLNVCTPSYSMVWWKWSHWEKQIDWMALNGINLPLAIVGQEFIWRKVFFDLGLTYEETSNYFTGPAFLAWWRMGNIQGWGGPLPSEWMESQRLLQHQILKRMRSFGMIPVLPGFSGNIPAALLSLFPNATVTQLGRWGHFNPPFCCLYLLDPMDPLFSKIASDFIKEYTKEFGSDHVYNVDTFNENEPHSSEPHYLSNMAKAVFNGLTKGDSQAVWLIQGWMFYHEREFWKTDQVKALLTAVPLGRMIVLDLSADVVPQYQRFESFYGQPFIWCMLQNYGGVQGLYGTIESINNGPFAARQFVNSTMIGTGLTMEGINQNEIMYELMNEMAWRTAPVNLKQWVKEFIFRRYGIENKWAMKAWQILKMRIYNCTSQYRHHGKYLLTRRPSLKLKSIIWYNPEDLFLAWNYIIKASTFPKLQKSSLFRYDLVDITRQALIVIGPYFYNLTITAFNQKNQELLRNAGQNLTNVLEDINLLTASDPHFLLGTMLESAKSKASTEELQDLYEWNARNQITLWGPSGEILDYASKQWSGLLSDYYLPRWSLFLQTLKSCIITSRKFNQTAFNDEVFNQVEKVFTFNKNVYPTQTQGDSIKIAQMLFRKYSWLAEVEQNLAYHNVVKPTLLYCLISLMLYIIYL